MSQYTVIVRQTFTTPVTVYAASPEEARRATVSGVGDWGEQRHTDPEIVAVRRQEGV